MEHFKTILPPNILETTERAGICTPRQVITLSIWDIEKLTGLQKQDIELLKKCVARSLCPQSVTCNKLLNCKDNKVRSGCRAIDNLLDGGFRRGVLSEVYGESGSGKTQLGMQLVANYAAEGSVYICTEDLFPIMRYNQIYENLSIQTGGSDNKMFVEHIYESSELLSCIRVRLPKLLQKHKISVIVLDSVAAPFRSETTNYKQRAEDLRELAIMLIKIAQEYNLAVICINQVTANFDDLSKTLLPSLGLAWSNMITYRFWLQKSSISNYLQKSKQVMTVRKLKSVFSPDLSNDSCDFIISKNGIVDF